MIVQCALCGATVTRRKRCKQYFCCVEHRNQWNREHVDFAGLSRGHRAQHLTELNNRRNPHCRVSVLGKANSQKAEVLQSSILEDCCRQERWYTT